MKFYFSGISDVATYRMIAEAKVENILVDPVDAPNVPETRRIGMLDSGAFRAFRQNTVIGLDGYLNRVRELEKRCDLIVAPDVVGDAAGSYRNWRAVKDAGVFRDRLVPVWQYNIAPFDHLEKYLSSSRIVGIGGLAKTMREDDTAEQRHRRDLTVKGLTLLAKGFPGRLHIFGLNYLPAIADLAPYCYSCDSSVWLRGARYGSVIFRHTKRGILTEAPAQAIPQYRRLSREERCILSAANIESFLAEEESRLNTQNSDAPENSARGDSAPNFPSDSPGVRIVRRGTRRPAA